MWVLPFLMFENDMKHIYAGVFEGFVSQTHIHLFQYKQVPHLLLVYTFWMSLFLASSYFNFETVTVKSSSFLKVAKMTAVRNVLDEINQKSVFLHHTIILWINTDASECSCCPPSCRLLSLLNDSCIATTKLRVSYPFARLSSSSSGRLFPRRSLSLR